jgi:protein N-terminal methyltransferase
VCGAATATPHHHHHHATEESVTLLLSALLDAQLSSLAHPTGGTDTGGNEYASIADMWSARVLSPSAPHHHRRHRHHSPHQTGEKINPTDTKEQNPTDTEGQNPTDTEEQNPTDTKVQSPTDTRELSWYAKAKQFWEAEENCPATIDGVLGGYAQVSPTDAQGSLHFIDRLRSLNLTCGQEKPVALDVGAGIGRVTREVLLKRFEHVDLLEVSQRLLSAAPDFIGQQHDVSRCQFYCRGMEQFSPAPGRYDVVWVQWVIGHLTDVDCVAFIRRCLDSLTATGVVVVKDNVCDDEDAFHVDLADSSVTRSFPYLMGLFNIAGAEAIEFKFQENFPEDIFEVPMFALRRKCP